MKWLVDGWIDRSMWLAFRVIDWWVTSTDRSVWVSA